MPLSPEPPFCQYQCVSNGNTGIMAHQGEVCKLIVLIFAYRKTQCVRKFRIWAVVLRAMWRM